MGFLDPLELGNGVLLFASKEDAEMKIKHSKIQAGDIFSTNEGGSVTVVEYRNAHEVLIEHNDESNHSALVRADHLRDGRVKNPFHPSVFGVGYVGVGGHNVSVKGKSTAAYEAWASMLRRCYSDEYLAKQPTYIGCSVHPDWFNFQTFAEWFNDQPNSQNHDFQLDKDLLALGNRVYSADTCSFLPQEINKLLNNQAASRGLYPQGVRASGKGYQAQLSVNGKRLSLGTYSSPEQAYTVYKAAKEQQVRSMAVEWREWLHHKVYANLMAWELQA